MFVYIIEMKLVVQKVIDIVFLGEVVEDMFGYFEFLYQVIFDMLRFLEIFLRRVVGWKEQVVNGDVGVVLEFFCFFKELVFLSLEFYLFRDLDFEVFCDFLEQLEFELGWVEQWVVFGGKCDFRNSFVFFIEKEGSIVGFQELDVWLLGIV